MRIGSRGSALALAQAEHVRRLLGGGEIVTIRTSGDEAPRGGDAAKESAEETAAKGEGEHTKGERPTDKSRWVDTIEQALLAGEIDIAVHSAKDVPGRLASGLALLGSPPRADVEDTLCGARDLADLRAGARVGTSSLRRTAELLAVRPDLHVLPMRGNVDTRLRKLAEGDLDAIVLARAGLQRLGREYEAEGSLDPAVFVPSPGQGTLALQGRASDEDVWRAAQEITDEVTFACLRAERALSHRLEASCDTPLGAWCHPLDGSMGESTGGGAMRLRAWVGLPDGSAWIADELDGSAAEPELLAARLAERMVLVGAREMLAQAEAAGQAEATAQ